MPRLSSFSRSLLSVGVNSIPPYAGPLLYWTPDANTVTTIDFTRTNIVQLDTTMSVTKTTYNSSVGPIRDKLFGEAAFNASNGALILQGGNPIDFSNWLPFYTGTAWTIEFWFQQSVNSLGNYQCLCYAGDSIAGGGRIWGAFFRNDGKIRFMDSSNEMVTSLSYNDGNIHHCAIQKLGNTMMMWIDGQDKVYRDITNAANNLTMKSIAFEIGNYLYTGVQNPSQYYIDAIRISDIARYPNTATVQVPTQPITRYTTGDYIVEHGGYYAGAIYYGVGGDVYDLFIAPKSDWKLGQYQESNTPITGARSAYDGAANTATLVATGQSPLANSVDAMTTNGFTDWYVPSILELAEVYWNLKPTTGANSTTDRSSIYSYNNLGINSDGHNPLHYPNASTATSTIPTMTTSPNFSLGGSQNINLGWIHSSTNSYNSANNPSTSNNLALVFDWASSGGSGPTGWYGSAAKTNYYYTLPMRKVLRQLLP